MLTLPRFEHHQPRTVAEAVALLRSHGASAKVMAGGTDLLPNMKHRLFEPAHVVSLKGIDELHGMVDDGKSLRLGALTTLSKLSQAPEVLRSFPSLARAASLVAGPQLRQMGTLGGNLCLDTRCVYYNQTYFWRQALGFCLKKDGTVCHVVKGGQKCVAAASNDTATALLTLGATVRLASADGVRTLPLDGFYVADGIVNTVLRPDELLVDVSVPKSPAQSLVGYQKLRLRASIDYPALSVAVAAMFSTGRTLLDVKVVVSALGARPHPVRRLEAFVGRELDDACIDELGLAAQRQCHPLSNINVDPAWRRRLIPVLVRRAFREASEAS